MQVPAIQTYSDSRLRGDWLVKPFTASYQWMRTAFNPCHPQANVLVECALRVVKVVTGVLAMIVTVWPALVGRLVQITHYHCMTKARRGFPPTCGVGNFTLPSPAMNSCPVPQAVYYGTDRALNILRWGFDRHPPAPTILTGEAIYASEIKGSSTEKKEELVLSLDLQPTEVASLNITSFELSETANLGKDKAAARTLFLQNGFRAIKYTGLSHDVWAIYDPSCISIQKVSIKN
ncbi:MAG: hypothetical protein KGJ02_04915 [Verrucomicrobiota bacterium]|nr:hypothetical protein [Verrucomicrobiota bacterium]